MRLDSGDLQIILHDIAAAIRRQDAVIRELEERITDAPKRMIRIESARYDACKRIVDAFKKAAGVTRLAGQKDLSKLFVERRVKLKRDREELHRRIVTVENMDLARVLRAGMPYDEIDINPKVADLIIFASGRRAIRHPLQAGVEKEVFKAISDSDRRQKEIELGLDYDRLLLDTAGCLLSDLRTGADLLAHTLQAVRHRESLAAQEMESVGIRKARADVAAVNAPAIEVRRTELEALARKLEDERWAEREARDSLGRFFACHPGLVKSMVSVLKNIRLLCGPVLKSDITEITPFEIGVAEKQYATTMEKLDSSDAFRCISEEERRAVFEALQSEDALACYNRADRARRSQLELEVAINLARQELAGMRRRASEEVVRKAEENRAASSELAKDVKKARRESRAGLEQVRKYFVDLRRKHGVRNGFSGFPKGHRGFMENLTDIRRLYWRTARRLYSEYEQNMRGNTKVARDAWQKLELLRSVGRARSGKPKSYLPDGYHANAPVERPKAG